MAIKKLTVSIEGLTSLLMNSMKMPNPDLVKKLDQATDEEIEAWAEYHAYRNQKGKLFVPGENLQQCIVGGGKYQILKGRTTLKKSVATGLLVTTEEAILKHDPTEIDLRYRVVPATKGRTLVARLKVPGGWTTTFSLEYDSDQLQHVQVVKALGDSGSRVGLMDWRPGAPISPGRYGKFKVVKVK